MMGYGRVFRKERVECIQIAQDCRNVYASESSINYVISSMMARVFESASEIARLKSMGPSDTPC